MSFVSQIFSIIFLKSDTKPDEIEKKNQNQNRTHLDYENGKELNMKECSGSTKTKFISSLYKRL